MLLRPFILLLLWEEIRLGSGAPLGEFCGLVVPPAPLSPSNGSCSQQLVTTSLSDGSGASQAARQRRSLAPPWLTDGYCRPVQVAVPSGDQEGAHEELGRREDDPSPHLSGWPQRPAEGDTVATTSRRSTFMPPRWRSFFLAFILVFVLIRVLSLEADDSYDPNTLTTAQLRLQPTFSSCGRYSCEHWLPVYAQWPHTTTNTDDTSTHRKIYPRILG